MDKPTGAKLRALAALAVVALASGACGDRLVEPLVNNVYRGKNGPDRQTVKSYAEFHKSLLIIDLHADSLLWNRSLLFHSKAGHVDLPRLVAGNVAVQVFAVATKTPSATNAPVGARLPHHNPKKQRKCRRADTLNPTGLLNAVQFRPFPTWSDLEERALNQARRLRRLAKQSKLDFKAGRATAYLKVIETFKDLESVLRKRRAGIKVVGALLAVEGVHWIPKDATTAQVKAAVGRLYTAGFRMVAPTHRFQNSLGASSEGCDQVAGLTSLGVEFLRAAEAGNMIVDLAHGSDKTIKDGALPRTGPAVFSHTGIRDWCAIGKDRCSIERNPSNAAIQAVVGTGGVVGVGYWPDAVGRHWDNIVGAFAHLHGILSRPAFKKKMQRLKGKGVYDPFDHIALGSDFDGTVRVPVDTSRLIELIAALATYKGGDSGLKFSKTAIRKIAGLNACRVLASRLPRGSPQKAKELCTP